MNAITPGGKIDTGRQIKPVKVAVLTISDTRDEESDTSGYVLAERVKDAGHELVDKAMSHVILPSMLYREQRYKLSK